MRLYFCERHPVGCVDCFPRPAFKKEVIATLLITIVTEGALVLGYSLWRRKPAVPILLTSIFANLFTQSLLWIGLNLFFQYYLLILFVAEIFIWAIESVLLYRVPANQLKLREAVFLSLIINLTSFGLGWLLPV
jgi:hypothetical protein